MNTIIGSQSPVINESMVFQGKEGIKQEARMRDVLDDYFREKPEYTEPKKERVIDDETGR